MNRTESAEELRCAARVIVQRIRVGRHLRSLPLDACLRALTPAQRRTTPPTSEELARLERWTRWLLRNRRLTRTTCLQRALVRYVLLTRDGARPTFVMGISDGDALLGHAWIEIDGAPAMEPAGPDCRPTFRYPNGDT